MVSHIVNKFEFISCVCLYLLFFFFQVKTSPVLEYQTLLQRLFTTTTVVEYKDVTVTRAANDWY